MLFMSYIISAQLGLTCTLQIHTNGEREESVPFKSDAFHVSSKRKPNVTVRNQLRLSTTLNKTSCLVLPITHTFNQDLVLPVLVQSPHLQLLLSRTEYRGWGRGGRELLGGSAEWKKMFRQF